MPTRSVEVTALLKAWSGGDQAALERLADQVYNELRRIARRYMRNERAGNTLQTTALVNEVPSPSGGEERRLAAAGTVLYDRRTDDAAHSCRCGTRPWLAQARRRSHQG